MIADAVLTGIETEKVERYLRSVLGDQIRVTGIALLGSGDGSKGFGYGTPLRVDYRLPGREPRRVVLHTMAAGPFGHEHMADRARILLWSHHAFNRLPQHVRSLDVAGFVQDGSLISLGAVDELCLLTEYAEGQAYACDLERLRDSGQANHLDLPRADALCDYLVEIHRAPVDNAELYVRRIRETRG